MIEDGRFEEVSRRNGNRCRRRAMDQSRWRPRPPGVIDGHVHFNDPGFTHRENFESGTTAAAAGGVTCIADMPCTSLPPNNNDLAGLSKRSFESLLPKAQLWTTFSGRRFPSNALQGDPRLGRKDPDPADAGVGAIKVYLLFGNGHLPGSLVPPNSRQVLSPRPIALEFQWESTRRTDRS